MIEIKGHIAGDRAYEIPIMVASLVMDKIEWKEYFPPFIVTKRQLQQLKRKFRND